MGFVGVFQPLDMFRSHMAKVMTSLDFISQDASIWPVKLLVLNYKRLFFFLFACLFVCLFFKETGSVPWIPATLDWTLCVYAYAFTYVSLWGPLSFLDPVRTFTQSEDILLDIPSKGWLRVQIWYLGSGYISEGRNANMHVCNVVCLYCSHIKVSLLNSKRTGCTVQNFHSETPVLWKV